MEKKIEKECLNILNISNINLMPQMVIISANDFIDEAKKLANHKSTRNNPISAGAIPVKTILCGLGSVLSSSSPKDYPEIIRTFINFCHKFGTRYVILLGDISLKGFSYFPSPEKIVNYSLGNDSSHTIYAQSFKGARACISLTLAISKIGNPDFPVHVEIKKDMNAQSITNFTIYPDDFAYSNGWNINRHFKYKRWQYLLPLFGISPMNPEREYYMVISVDETDRDNHYQIAVYNESYIPDGEFIEVRNNLSISHPNQDILFRLQMYTDVSIPTRYVRYHRVYSEPPWLQDIVMPSDDYYACVDGPDWDSNNNGWYLDEGDQNVDRILDVSIGRLPADNSIEAQTIVNKIISYENNPSSQNGLSILCAGRNGPYDPCYFVDWIEDYLLPIFTVNFPPVYKAYTLPPDCNEDRDAFMQHFNEGVEAVASRGHGSPTGCPCIPYDMVRDDLVSVEGRFPVIYAISCGTSFYDIDPDVPIGDATDCLGELFIVKGLANYIGYTRAAYPCSVDVDFWLKFINCWRAGDALKEVKNINGISQDSLKIILFGDPETYHRPIYMKNPHNILSMAFGRLLPSHLLSRFISWYQMTSIT